MLPLLGLTTICTLLCRFNISIIFFHVPADAVAVRTSIGRPWGRSDLILPTAPHHFLKGFFLLQSLSPLNINRKINNHYYKKILFIFVMVNDIPCEHFRLKLLLLFFRCMAFADCKLQAISYCRLQFHTQLKLIRGHGFESRSGPVLTLFTV